MKKTLSCLLAFLLGGSLLTGCSGHDDPFTQKHYTSEGQPISAVSIDVRDRQVEVTPSADEQIHIDYFESSQEYYHISVSEDHVLTMTAASDKEWTDYIGGKASADVRKISLQVPDALLDTLKIATTNEDISVAALSLTGDVSLTANGGSISFESLRVGKDIALDVKNGSISGAISGSYDDYAISCKIKKGKSNLPADKEKGSRKLSVAANNGDVTIDFT